MLNVIFMPAISLMNSLKYPKKLLLLGIITATVVALLTYQIVVQSLTVANFSKKELLGIDYINPLISVRNMIQQYRQWGNAMVAGDINLKNKLTVLKNNIDKAVAVMNEKDFELNRELDTSKSWNNIKAKWGTLKLAPLDAKNFSLYSDILSNINRLIVTACDNSNLTLDPDIDTYYLMDTYCTKLPSFVEEAGLIQDIGVSAIHKKALSQEDQSQLVILNTLMADFNEDSIRGNLNKVLLAAPFLSTKFEDLEKEFSSRVIDVTNLLKNTVLSKNFNVTVENYSNVYSDLIEISNQLANVTGVTLKELLLVRVKKILDSLYINVSIAILGLLLLLYLFIGIYLSIIKNVRELAKGSDKLANGDLNTMVNLQTRDELQQVASSFNVMQNVLANMINETQGVLSSMLEGDLNKRIEIENKKGFARNLALSINKMNETSQTVISELVKVLDAFSKGDLTVKIENEYRGTFEQLKRYANITSESLQKLIHAIKISIKTINDSAKVIASGSSQLAKRTDQETTFFEKTSATIEELTTTVKQNAEHAKKANNLTLSASDVAMKGREVVSQVINKMTSINDSAQKVADIITVIDSIAFQTNILALNAAVEAARAGEQGRGFAVVATEVRNLAKRSSDAAKEIKDLIGNSVEIVVDGTKLVDKAGATMGDMVEAVKQVTEIVSAIAIASIDQSNAIEQVSQSVSQINKVTGETNALVEEAARNAEFMETETYRMNELMKVFKLNMVISEETNTMEAVKKNKDKKNQEWEEF